MARAVRIQMSHQRKLSGRLFQTRRTEIFTAADTLSIHEYIGDCRKVQSELIQTHPTGGGAVGKQIKLFFDAILHIAASTVDITLHCFRILSRQKSESSRKMIRTSGNLALIAPTSFIKISSVPSQASTLDDRRRAIRGRSSQNT